MGFFSESYLSKNPIALVKKEEKIIAFANILPAANKCELSIDLMRYLPGENHGIMDFLFVSLFLWGQEQGYAYFNLGMAPMSGIENRKQAPLWNKLGGFLYRHGEHFYNFDGLRKYKEKFYQSGKQNIYFARGFEKKFCFKRFGNFDFRRNERSAWKSKI